MPPESLGKVLDRLGDTSHPDLLAGTDGFEDAGVFRLDSERALVQTTDFFPPIVDDPRWFGRIAAANALSDVYAMGGHVLTALNIVGWPKDLDTALLGEVLAGGLEKVREAGGALCGGHSVTDQEIKYGLAVTGLVHPDRFWRNGGARAGDVCVLTKPLGMGPVSTGIKRELVDDDVVAAAMEQMSALNRGAAEALAELDVHAATDVTGFGLVGHGREMAVGAELALEVVAADIPFADGALALARDGVLSGGSRRGRAMFGTAVEIADGVEPALTDVLFDAETSGGLLVALPEAQADAALARLRDEGTTCAAVVGRFVAREAPGIDVVVR